MQRRGCRLALVGLTVAALALLAVGCGGGGGGTSGDAPSPPPPPPPPPVEIGRGPGPEADTIPTGETISTAAARGVPFATAPDAELARRAAIERIDQFASDLPTTENDLRAVLDDFTAWAQAEPNDAVSQVGLAAAIVVVGGYNAGIDAGYTTGQILSLLDPVTEVASTGLRDEAGGHTLTAADFPSPTDPDFSSADLQISIRKFLLPALRHARTRLEAVSSSAAGPAARLAEFPSRHGTHYAYRADVRAIGGAFRIGHALLLQFCAYQFNPDDWDWTASMADRDGDGNGELAVEEYLPGDPFLWRHNSTNMLWSGGALRGGLEAMIAAVGEAPDDSMLVQALRPDSPQVAQQKLRDLHAMVDREVQVQIEHEGGSDGAGSFSTRMDLSRLWDAPIDDLKELFPTLRPVSGSYWEALPRDASDFPEPELGGVFPQPRPVLEMLSTGPTYITIRHGSMDRLTVIDRRGEQ
ncbi:MAG: hypothetical protein R6V07_06345 [Armatimonadota bacterium]